MYSWKASYIAAVCEMNPALVRRRIVAAVAAIEERLRKPLEPGSHEDKELKQAQAVIAVLRKEHSV